ncbi:MAG: MmcB family DNA repair protein [Rhodospirillales bacterium]|jgi:hypothetical protein|nr:MmcB family DNA repair protein [Rhodospirillales bacterium]
MTEPAPLLTLDGRQSAAAAAIQRGVTRLLRAHGFATLTEVTLASGNRADVLAIGRSGELFIVEIKSSLADFRSDRKWPNYCDYCDRFYFAAGADFDQAVLPPDRGLIIADRHGGEFVRHPADDRLAAGRRRAVTLLFARLAAARLQSGLDPDFTSP